MIVPLLFLGLPIAVSVAAWFLRRWLWLQGGLAALTTVSLCLFALQIPLDTVAVFMERDFKFEAAWVILGRSFTFTEADRPMLVFIYLLATLFFVSGAAGKIPRSFMPVGLVILSLVAAIIFVRPFLFAALFLEMIAAFSALILAEDDNPNSRGALRLLIFVTLAVPFILLAGWQLEGLETSPEDSELLARAALLLNIGLLILLSVAPFYSWIPNVSDDSAPLAAAFVFAIVQSAALFFLIKFLNQFDWLRANPAQFGLLRLGGATLVLGGGLFAFAQRRFGRLMGYAVLIDLGAMLIAVGESETRGLGVALTIVALRGLGLVVWGLGLGWLRAHSRQPGSDDFDDVSGLAWEMPFAAVAMTLGGLSVAAVPLTAGFVGRWALFRQLATHDLTLAFILLVAGVSVMLSYGRGVAALFKRSGEEAATEIGVREDPAAMVFLSLGILLIILLGLFPQWLLGAVIQAAQTFGP